MTTQGWCGVTWGEGHTPTYLFAYNQDNNAFHFPRVPLPGLERTEPGQLDGIINGGDGFLYVGTVQGGLFRLDPSDPDKPELAFLGKPAAKWRMPAFVIGDDGLLYILAGGEYDVHIFSYDRAGKRFADLGRVVDEERNISCFMPHDLALTPDGMAYVGETDHPSDRAICGNVSSKGEALLDARGLRFLGARPRAFFLRTVRGMTGVSRVAPSGPGLRAATEGLPRVRPHR